MGPCLCGDPYCPSCGNPSAAAWEDLHCDVTDLVIAKKPKLNSQNALDAIAATLDVLAEDADMAMVLEAWQARRKERNRLLDLIRYMESRQNFARKSMQH